MSMIVFKAMSKSYETQLVLTTIDLSIDRGQVTVVVGPSGSRKSTILRSINLLEQISGGDLTDGISVRCSQSEIGRIRLGAGMVFQQFNLFPHLTSLENVMFGPIRS